jgi:hypothetical protein
MPSTSGNFFYVVKYPGKSAESTTLPDGTEFLEEFYRVINSSEGNLPEREGSLGDRSYPEHLGKQDLRVLFDDEFGLKPMQPNRWGIKGPIMIVRLGDDEFTSLQADEIEGIISDLEQELPEDPNNWEQKMKNMSKYF